ncbi:LexA family protein [Mucilaginibacter myungsuensis]|uniref:S24 family peptidase n=1 Tax=Mucilaginibacter myungsuensis TaxID=649104 RepID=A0A929KZ86_9SPHI|nr:S24 family peptidase [Mucilaginibacter myungsuensis]MBE9662663.1 S24 family peptidase [Mucilaginibacter myungsuensis]MDN3598083.1 S24 family peptidase [Mucilaginibacter myungsuensis]
MLTHEEPELDVTDIIVMDPDNTFYMRMGTDAMRGHCILKDHVLVIDRSLTPIAGSIVVFYHEGEFYTREYAPESGRLVLKADLPADSVIVENNEDWRCWGVVTVALNPLIHPLQRVGRYAYVCAC